MRPHAGQHQDQLMLSQPSTSSQAPSQRPRVLSPRRGGKDAVPMEQLLEKLQSLERYKQDEEKWKKKDEQQRKKDLALAKKKLAQEINQTRSLLKKRSNEAKKLKQTLQKIEKQQVESTQKKTLSAQRIDETLMKCEEKHNYAEVELQEKIGEVGEANGLLAYLEHAQALLDKGVFLEPDPRAAQMMAENGRLKALADGHNVLETGPFERSTSSNEAMHLERELAEMRAFYEEAEEQRQWLLAQLKAVGNTKAIAENEELSRLRRENQDLRAENQELRKRLGMTSVGLDMTQMKRPSREFDAASNQSLKGLHDAPAAASVPRSLTPPRLQNGAWVAGGSVTAFAYPSVTTGASLTMSNRGLTGFNSSVPSEREAGAHSPSPVYATWAPQDHGRPHTPRGGLLSGPSSVAIPMALPSQLQASSSTPSIYLDTRRPSPSPPARAVVQAVSPAAPIYAQSPHRLVATPQQHSLQPSRLISAPLVPGTASFSIRSVAVAAPQIASRSPTAPVAQLAATSKNPSFTPLPQSVAPPKAGNDPMFFMEPVTASAVNVGSMSQTSPGSQQNLVTRLL